MAYLAWCTGGLTRPHDAVDEHLPIHTKLANMGNLKSYVLLEVRVVLSSSNHH